MSSRFYVLFILFLSNIYFISSIYSAPIEGFSSVVKSTLPAVVNIRTVRVEKLSSENLDLRGLNLGEGFPPGSPLRELFERFMLPPGGGQGDHRGVSAGSGFLIDSEGLVVTNNHVIEGAETIEVNTQNGEKFLADLVGTDPQTDLAVLRLKSVEVELPYLEFGDSDRVEVGDWTIAIGNPLGNLGGSVTAGIVSARNRDIRTGLYDDYIQTDASINRGNSGGPLLNTSGEVIGVNTIIFSSNGGGSIGLSFSIPSNLAKLVVGQLVSSGEASRGWLGVEIVNVEEDVSDALDYDGNSGALVTRVLPGSPAEKAGFKSYDIITRFGDKIVPNSRRLPLIVGLSEVDSVVPVEIWRDGGKRTLRVRLGLRDDRAIARSGGVSPDDGGSDESGSDDITENGLGIEVADINDQIREKVGLEKGEGGAVIVRIAEGGQAFDKGIRVGDVILEINKSKVMKSRDVNELLLKAQREGKKVALVRLRASDRRNVVVGFRIGG